MAKVKYRIREFKPTQNLLSPLWQGGGYKAGVEMRLAPRLRPSPVWRGLSNITNKELAKKVHDVGSISSPAEIKAILEVLATVIQTEAAENNRIQLESGDGGALVSIYPSCTGSVSDKEVLANPEQFGGATVATADMLTAERIKWSLSASVGRKFSQQFALNKQAQRVDYNPNQETADPEPETPGGGGNGGGGNTPGGELEG